MTTDLFLDYRGSLHQDGARITEGEVASYIPELLKVNPDWFGIAVVTVDGQVYQVGDTQQAFTIQSISKVITYGIALEWCEDRLLVERSAHPMEKVPLAAQAFCAGFTAAELQALESLLEPKTYPKSAYICREGEVATGMFFILSGQVSVVVPIDHRRTGRISTWSEGSAFGEMAIFDHGVRSADVVADTDLSCLFLSYENLENDGSELGARIRLKLITNIGQVLAQKLRQATVEIKSLKS